MIDFLESILEVILAALEGLATFVIKLIPLVLKVIFFISPFLLIVFAAYITQGLWFAGIASVVVLTIILVGLGYANSQNITGSVVSARAIGAVLIADLLIVAFIVIEVNFFSSSPQPTNASVKSSNTKSESKEEVFLKLLDDSIANKDKDGINRAVSELKGMHSYYAVPLIIKALRMYYPSVDRDYQARMLCVSCIYALGEIKSKEACNILYEIQVKSSDLFQHAQKASSEICK